MAQDLEASSLDNTPELKEIPPIRDNPDMALTTSKRRSSVAHPHSYQYRGPTHDDSSSDHSSSSEDGDDEDSIDDLNHYHNMNINKYHNEKTASDPSISDLNEILSQTPSQPPPKPQDDDENDDGDPFARLGLKQQSVALPPLIQSIEEQQRVHQQHLQARHTSPNAVLSNPYSPAAILEPKHLQHRHSTKHSRGGSKHSRSQTLASHSSQHSNYLDRQLPLSARNKIKRRRNQSSSVDWSDNMLGPPSGPELTFLCMKIENRTVLQDTLSDDKYLQLMKIHNGIFEEALKQFNGHCIEQHNGHVYDALTVFNDVYDAIRCGINIQKELHLYKWPSFYYEVEKRSARMHYIGTGGKDAFNGLRVGMALHTACVDKEINKYDGGKETCRVTTVIFDAAYKGTAVDLVKELCIKSYGGELLATKALSQALIRSRKGGDEISVQRLGVCTIKNIRDVELIQLAPRDIPHRDFPPRSFMGNAAKKQLMLQMLQESETPSYDPFPSHVSDEEPDDQETSEYDTVNEIAHDSHSSGDDEVQHKAPRRRPSITQFVTAPNSTIEVSFDGGTDSDIDEKEETGYDIKYNDNYLDVHGNEMDSDHSIDPPKQQSTRSKALEIEKRKSMKHDDEVTNMLIRETEPKKKGKKKKVKKKPKRKRNGNHADDESTPLPGDTDSAYFNTNNAISKPKRKPRANKKAEHYDTMVGIKFDPDDSSQYSAGSRSIRTSTTAKSHTILNPAQQLKLFKIRPLNLPDAYNDDKEFTCLCCQDYKKWTTGVWRVPMWPSFDVCVECGNKELQSGTSKKAIDNFNPSAGAMGILYPQHGSESNMKHRKIPSNQPLMKEYVDGVAANENKMTQEALVILRKELSSIIEELTNEKLQRLDNLSNWAQNDQDFEEFNNKITAEHNATEDEIKSWRKKANRLDEQEQRVMRRRNTVGIESPHVSDLESDEELHQNWQDYDYNEDFSTIHSRLKELDQVFWTEDRFFRMRSENQNKANELKLQQLQSQYAQTTHLLQQRNDELSHKINELLSEAAGGNINKDKYHNILNNGDNIDEYSSDDLENTNMDKYGAYVPPSVKHIHKHSQILNAAELAKHLNTGDVEDQKKLVLLQNTIAELNTQIDNYISTVNRKDRRIREQEATMDELQQKVHYLENLNDTEEQFAELHKELTAVKEENVELQSKLKIYLYDEPSQHTLSANEDSFSNMLFDDNFSAEQKDAMEANKDKEEVVMDQNKENEVRLKAAKSRIETLQENMDELRDENGRLTKSKQELLNRTSNVIEEMRDELQNMCGQLQDKDNTIRRLIRVNKEGYDPSAEHDQKTDTNARGSLTDPLGIGNSIAGLWTYGRSKFSSSARTVSETKKSKIDLAVSTSTEIQRLREIIKALTTSNGTTYGDATNSLIGAADPGSGSY